MRNIYMALLCLLCLACAKPYYGYTESEWNNLSEKDKAAAKAEYEQIIQSNRDQKHKDLIEQRKLDVIDYGVNQ